MNTLVVILFQIGGNWCFFQVGYFESQSKVPEKKALFEEKISFLMTPSKLPFSDVQTLGIHAPKIRLLTNQNFLRKTFKGK